MDTYPEIENFGSFGDEEQAAEPVDLILKFEKPYEFEGETYTELDLSALEQWNAGKYCAAEKAYRMRNPASLLPLTETEFRLLVAVKATGKPVEFFRLMPVGLANAVANMVLSFFGR